MLHTKDGTVKLKPAKKDRAAWAFRGKSLAKPGDILKRRIAMRTFYTPEERKLPGFIQIDTAGL
jgi:hypothetical protein